MPTGLLDYNNLLSSNPSKLSQGMESKIQAKILYQLVSAFEEALAPFSREICKDNESLQIPAF
jgi:hypothetical protein